MRKLDSGPTKKDSKKNIIKMKFYFDLRFL